MKLITYYVKGYKDLWFNYCTWLRKLGLRWREDSDERSRFSINGYWCCKWWNRTAEATKKAISSPLLEVSIDGAEQILLNITGGSDLTLFEAQDASDIVAAASTSEVNIIFGTSINENLGDEVIVTVIATGIDEERKHEKSQQLALIVLHSQIVLQLVKI